MLPMKTELSECVCQNAEKTDKRWHGDGPQTWLAKGWLEKQKLCFNLFAYLFVYLLFAVLAIEPRISCMLDKKSVYSSPNLYLYLT